MADWMSQMANAVDEYEAASSPSDLRHLPGAYHDEVPTEPATSPRSQCR